jgi:Fe-S-cluster-containing dehydrogenase component
MACPYGVRNWNKTEKVVEKCTLCNHLTAVGELPACVKVCCGKARYYGDLDDPTSEASQAVAAAASDAVHHLPDVGNEPKTAYLLSPKYAEWKGGEL